MKMPEDFLLKISKLGSNFDSVADTVLQAGGEVVLKKYSPIGEIAAIAKDYTEEEILNAINLFATENLSGEEE